MAIANAVPVAPGVLYQSTTSVESTIAIKGGMVSPTHTNTVSITNGGFSIGQSQSGAVIIVSMLQVAPVPKDSVNCKRESAGIPTMVCGFVPAPNAPKLGTNTVPLVNTCTL